MYICTFVSMYVCMYVCVCIVRECEGLESCLAWHHNLGVMETIRSQIESTTTGVCGEWGGGGGECKSILQHRSPGGLLCSSSGLGRGKCRMRGGAKDKIVGVWSWGA